MTAAEHRRPARIRRPRDRPRAAGSPRGPELFVVALSGCLGAAAGCSPSGSSVADLVLAGGLAAGVALAATTASAVTLMIGAALVVAAGDSLPLHVVGLIALGAIVLLQRDDGARSLERAVIGTVTVQALLRLPWTSPARATAVVACVGLAPILVSGALGASPRVRRIVFRSAWIAGALAGVAVVVSGYAVARSHTLLKAGEDDARIAVDAARGGHRDQAAAAFAKAQRRFDDAHNLLASWTTLPARQLPIVGPQLRVLEQVASIGTNTIPVARDGLTKVDPDRLRLVNGRIDLETVASYKPVFSRLAVETRAARRRLARLSRVWLLPQLDRPLTRFADTVAQADESAHTADEAVALAPSILGGSGRRTYLLAIVTPAEARGGGGYLANYGVLTIENGRLDLEKVGRAPNLDFVGKQPKRYTASSEYLARYAKYPPASAWRVVTMSPDFPSVARVMAQLYPQSGGTPIDGVIRLDPVAMSGLLRLSGPVRVPGLPVTLDANNVVDYLLRDQYKLVTDVELRHDLLGDVARAAFDRLTTGRSAQPSGWGNALSPAVRTGNLALWFRDARSQALARRIGADAALPPATGDSFGVMVQNGGGSKIDEYLHRTIRYTATVSATGSVHARGAVALKNAAPAKGLPLYVIGNQLGLPVGTSRLYVSLYSPLRLRRVMLEGRPLVMFAERELGRNVYSAFVDIPAGATRAVSFELAGSVSLANGGYRFAYLHASLPQPDVVNLAVRAPDARVVAATATGAAPIPVKVAPASATVRTSVHGPWSVDVRLRR